MLTYKANGIDFDGQMYPARYRVTEMGNVFACFMTPDGVRMHRVEPGEEGYSNALCAANASLAASQAATNAENVAEVGEGKPWIGTRIAGCGWEVYFDPQCGRTRVILSADAAAPMTEAVQAAGFYWSNAMGSWNRKLTCRAYRATQALCARLHDLAGIAA